MLVTLNLFFEYTFESKLKQVYFKNKKRKE